MVRRNSFSALRSSTTQQAKLWGLALSAMTVRIGSSSLKRVTPGVDNAGTKPGGEDKPSKEDMEATKKHKQEQRQKLYAQMHTCNLWLDYHKNSPSVYDEWMGIGFTEEEINKWGLGFCSACPLSPEHTSLTIPVWFKGKLWDIRHRLIGAEQGKYRSHLPGLVPPFYNLDAILTSRQVYVVEGEKKTIKCVSCGVPAVIGYPGIQFFKRIPEILNKYLDSTQQVIFIPDPGTTDKIIEMAQQIKVPCYLVDLWMKPDDLILEHGADMFMSAIRMPRPI